MKVMDVALVAPAVRARWMVRLHWLSALLIVLGFFLILLRETLEAKDLRMWLLELHRWCGLLVLVLLVARLLSSARQAASTEPLWIRVAAATTHATLYLLLAVLPLLGWAFSSAVGQSANLFGMPLLALVAEDEDLAETLLNWHVAIAWVLAALILVHIAAALWHHLIRRDDVLRSMWPLWPR